ncbi:DUF1697 domain-containing protein [uncultured Paracoccus sp.]|uniref:DUF1697 domain-containing protein n=1 Tax=uncultured Paracoccus sp. TaxID=189685 RepID=UPI00260F84EE|nr:DUF1697 domain-containing protein [uncultured Paracoccus sp.]
MNPDQDIWIALIRAIGGGTHAKLSMADLRGACAARGLRDARTILATGNVVFRSALPEAEVSDHLNGIMAAHGLTNAVFLRRPAELRQALNANPFPELATERPSRLLVMFLSQPPDPAADTLPAGYPGPERLRLIGREVFIDYPESIGQSKLTPARLERHFGQPGTARNWNSLGRILAACTPG